MNYEEEKIWRDELQKSDRVATQHYGLGVNYSIQTIERITKTQIILANGERYRRSDGYRIGQDSYYRKSIQPITEQVLEWLKMDRLKSEYWKNFDKLKTEGRKLTTQELEFINDFLTPFFNSRDAILLQKSQSQEDGQSAPKE